MLKIQCSHCLFAQRARLRVTFEKGYSGRTLLLVPDDQILALCVQAHTVRVDSSGGHNAVGRDVGELARHRAPVVLGGGQPEVGDGVIAVVLAHERVGHVKVGAPVAVGLEQQVRHRTLVAVGADGRLEPLQELEGARGEVHLEREELLGRLAQREVAGRVLPVRGVERAAAGAAAVRYGDRAEGFDVVVVDGAQDDERVRPPVTDDVYPAGGIRHDLRNVMFGAVVVRGK